MIRNCFIGGCAAASLLGAPGAWGAPRHGEPQEIVVTATPLAEDRHGTAQPASVLAGDELLLALTPTLGETVAREPGVHSTYFGAGASRPVIRGLGGDRVQVLTDGLATLDASGLSEDHAVAIDPALSDQIEVVRGPATLLYGSGASGGVVNVVTSRIHDSVPAQPEGHLELRGDTAHEERALAGRVDAGFGRLALHLDGVWRDTEDYEIPGFAQSRNLREELAAAGEEPDGARGTVPNSWTETAAAGIGATWVGDDWLAGLAWSRHDTEYGIPGGHGHEDGELPGEAPREEGGLSIDLLQDRWDLVLRRSFAGGSALRVSAAASDYEHAEIEDSGQVGTLYRVDGRELRLAWDHRLPRGFEGTAGLQVQQVELAASGAEAFVPDSRTRTLGAFVFEQRDFERWTLELGARVDRQEVDGAGLPGYEDTAVNLSAGVIRPLGDDVALVAQVARTERHPSATELYAFGPHAATGQFEVGNAGFRSERGLQADVGLRLESGTLGAELRAFASAYHGYLFLSPTGEVVEDLPVFEYLQDDASFRGIEVTATWTPGNSGWSFGLTADAVRGSLGDGGDLPRMPPLRLGAEIAWQRDVLHAAVSARHSFGQDQVAGYELPTDAYTMLDAEFAWQPGWGGAGTRVFLRATNLLDEDARVHSSPLKDEVPLPGRSLAAGLRLSFGD